MGNSLSLRDLIVCVLVTSNVAPPKSADPPCIEMGEEMGDVPIAVFWVAPEERVRPVVDGYPPALRSMVTPPTPQEKVPVPEDRSTGPAAALLSINSVPPVTLAAVPFNRLAMVISVKESVPLLTATVSMVLPDAGVIDAELPVTAREPVDVIFPVKVPPPMESALAPMVRDPEPLKLEGASGVEMVTKVAFAPIVIVAGPTKKLPGASVKGNVFARVRALAFLKIPVKVPAPPLTVRALPSMFSVAVGEPPPVFLKLERVRETLERKVELFSMEADHPVELLPRASSMRAPEVRARELELVKTPVKLPPPTVRVLAPIASVPPEPFKLEKMAFRRAVYVPSLRVTVLRIVVPLEEASVKDDPEPVTVRAVLEGREAIKLPLPLTVVPPP